MSADQPPLWMNLINALVALIRCHTDLLINPSKPAQLLDVTVHRLVGIERQRMVILEINITVLVQNRP